MAGKGVDYNVTTHLKMVDKMSGGLMKIGGRIQALGTMIRGTAMEAGLMYAKIGAGAVAASGAAGLGAMVMKGLQFNKLMEDSKSQIATVFQMFGQNAKAMGENTTLGEQFAAKLNLAQTSMDQMYQIAKKPPASLGQVTTLFKNSAAGLASTTEDVDRQIKLIEKAVLAGGLTGGDYEVLGSQMGRILSGSAGAEMDVYKTMQKPMLEAGQALGFFNKNMQANSKLTEEFNKLTGEQRLQIMEKAMEGLAGPVAEYYANTMGGILSTTESAIDSVSGKLTESLFDGFKKFLIKANAEGGMFGPENLAKLEEAATFFGEALAKGANFLYTQIEKGVVYFGNNWEEISMKLAHAFDVAYKAAKLYVKVAAARAIVGTGVGAVGKGMSMAGGIGKAGMQVAEMVKTSGVSLAKLGTAALYALPAIIGLAAVIAGSAVAFAGMAAFFVENFDAIVQGLRSGAVSIQPLLTAMDVLWYALVRVGETFLGSTDPVEQMNTLVGIGTSIVYGMVDAMRFFLSAAGWTIVAVDQIGRIYGTVHGGMYTAVVKFADLALSVMARLLEEIADLIPGEGFADKGAASLRAAQQAVAEHGDASLQFVKDQMAGFGEFDNKFLRAAEAIDLPDERVGQGSALSNTFRDMLDRFGQEKIEPYGPELPPNMNPDGSKKKTPPVGGRGNVNINNLTIQQDLRDTDPDRILAAMIDPIKEMADRPRTSYFSTSQGA